MEKKVLVDSSSCIKSTGDWSIDDNTFDYVKRLYSPFNNGRFADNLKRKVEKLNLKLVHVLLILLQATRAMSQIDLILKFRI